MLALSPAALGWSILKPHHSDVMMIEPAVASEVWPSEANFELGPQVVSYDVPFAWRHTVPTAQPGQTATPLLQPDGGVLAVDAPISIVLDAPCEAEHPTTTSTADILESNNALPSPQPGVPAIWYTCDGSVPVPGAARRYDGPFVLRDCCAERQWWQPSYVVVGAVGVCAGREPSPVNSRWFYAAVRTPPATITGAGRVLSCSAATLNVSVDSGRGAELYYSFTRMASARAWEAAAAASHAPLIVRTQSGCVCDLPFVYRGKTYDACTSTDWPGSPWCYVRGETCGTPYFSRRFDRCAPFDSGDADARLALPAVATPSPTPGAALEGAMAPPLVAKPLRRWVQLHAERNAAATAAVRVAEAGRATIMVQPGEVVRVAAVATRPGALESTVAEASLEVSCAAARVGVE